MRRTYHRFPQKPEFERKFRFEADLPFIVRTMSGLDGQSGTFFTDGPDKNGTPVEAKRFINVEIAQNRVDLLPLNKNTLDLVIRDIASEGTIDFIINLKYSFLDTNYNRVGFNGDTYIVRTILENGILTMQIHLIDGYARTHCERIADTIVEEIKRNE